MRDHRKHKKGMKRRSLNKLIQKKEAM